MTIPHKEVIIFWGRGCSPVMLFEMFLKEMKTCCMQFACTLVESSRQCQK